MFFFNEKIKQEKKKNVRTVVERNMLQMQFSSDKNIIFLLRNSIPLDTPQIGGNGKLKV